MKDSLRTLVAGATGAVIASAILLGQPALADVNAKALAKDSVTSKSIKNGTVKTKDLAADVNASLAKANTALQSVADNSITNPKLADNSVGSAEVTDNSLAAADLAPNSVGGSELADGSVDINSHSRGGFAGVVVPNLAVNACANVTLDTGGATFGFLAAVSPGLTAEAGLFVEGVRTGSPTDLLLFRVCNRGAGAYVSDTEQFLWTVEF